MIRPESSSMTKPHDRTALALALLSLQSVFPSWAQETSLDSTRAHSSASREATNGNHYDLCIRGGTLIDGTRATRRTANLYVSDGHIVAITPVDDRRPATCEIDASGLVVTPGFIDTHAHGDPVRTPDFGNFLSMGVTTICLGQDGESPEDTAGWFRSVQKVALGPNIALFAGHGTARNAVGIGNDSQPTPPQIEAMAEWVRLAMSHGCLGLTTGLEYQPGSFADLEELVAVARPVALAGGVIMSHMRSEDDDAIQAAVAEFLEQGRRSNCAVHISHLKVTYGHGAERAERVLSQMAEARQAGMQVTADLYPYLASYTGIGIVFPDWAKPPHNYQQVVHTRRDELARYLRGRIQLRNGPEATLLATAPWTGKTLAEVAAQLHRPFEEVLIDEMSPSSDVKAAYFVMDADLQERLLVDPYVMICSDGSPTMRHPRGYGAFARVIREFVVQRKILSLEEAVYKMTGLPAAATGLERNGRGQIREGFAADLLIFDPQEVRDHATFEDPFQFASGFQWVIVNGEIASHNGRATGHRSGRLLKREPPSIDIAALARKVNILLEPFDGDDVPGAAVMVIQDGKPLLQKTVGMADINRGIHVDSQTNFRLASITKQFTAMAIMQLKQRGLLAYDDPLSKFFPDSPDIGKQITVRQLLWHTSGIIDYEELMPTGQTAQLLDADIWNLLKQQHGTYFTPGSEFRYSNSGYALLALIVERVSGKPFARYLDAEIFRPLGMNNTVAFEQGKTTVSHRAFGYKHSHGVFQDADQSLTSAVLGDGGIYTSLTDYLLWDQALYGERLVTQQTLQDAFRAGHLQQPETSTGYGFGWRIETRRETRRVHHDGSTSGFNHAVRRLPDKRMTIVVLTNRAGNHAAPIADDILTHLSD